MKFAARSALIALAALGLSSHAAGAQTYGFATLPPGTLNHTTASAVAKVMKEKAGMNMLVQPTAGDQVIVPQRSWLSRNPSLVATGLTAFAIVFTAIVRR